MEHSYHLIQYRFTKGQQLGILVGVSIIAFLLLYSVIIIINAEWGMEFHYAGLAALLFLLMEYGLAKLLMKIKKTGQIVFRDNHLTVESFFEIGQLSIPYKQIKSIEIIRGIRKDIFIKNNQYLSYHLIFVLNNNQLLPMQVENGNKPLLLESIYRIAQENSISVVI